ncbi:alpha/beta fold hydrolase [Actinophytocola sp.]|uniref:alpha/beta fold hydrolase n=1 Tax=Actinophytocola sp. TaxID=1872138 RepID=UPI003D6C0D48
MAVPLVHRTTGAAGGPPVVLLHGLGENAGTWERFAAELAASRTAIALDLRGHGSSPWPGQYTVDAMADDVLAFLDGVPLVDLVGHSMGGYVAALVAARYPERVGRLVLEETPVPPRDGDPLPDDNPPTEPDGPLAFDWHAVTPMRRGLRAPNPLWWQGIEHVSARTLWISGGPSSHLDPARVAMVAATMPAATIVTIPVGHLVHTDAPDEFARAVLPFLSADGEPESP